MNYYYYAIRRGDHICHTNTASSWDVTMIMKDGECFVPGWINDYENGDHYYGSGITKDEYDMLLAFGVEEITLGELRCKMSLPSDDDRLVQVVPQMVR